METSPQVESKALAGNAQALSTWMVHTMKQHVHQPTALFVLPDLEYRGIAKQACELIKALPREQWRLQVCALGKSGSWRDELQQLGVKVDVLHRRGWWDVSAHYQLHQLSKQHNPEMVHVWGMSTLRTLALTGWKGRCLVTPCLTEKSEQSWCRIVDRWLLKRADHVLPLGHVDAHWCRQWEIAPEKMTPLTPSLAVRSLPASAQLSGVPDDAKVILCVGRLEMHKGFQETIWAADILRYPHPNLHVVIVGDGPDRARLEKFAHDLSGPGVTHFVGEQEDVLPWIRRADLVWSTGRRETGSQVILEAMMAGRAVIAHRWFGLQELIRDGETGFFVTPGDKVALAKCGHRLLTDANLCQQIGRAARKAVMELFDIQSMVRAWQSVSGTRSEQKVAA